MTINSQPHQPNNPILKQVLARSFVVAIVLGSCLTLLNQSDAFIGQADIQWLPLMLMYFTPFLVVTVSQFTGARAAQNTTSRETGASEKFLTTLFSHRILMRAAVLALAVGCFNTAIIAGESILAGRDHEQLPMILIVQSVLLPLMFGALSQTLSFRRAISVSAQPVGKNNLI